MGMIGHQTLSLRFFRSIVIFWFISLLFKMQCKIKKSESWKDRKQWSNHFSDLILSQLYTLAQANYLKIHQALKVLFPLVKQFKWLTTMNVKNGKKRRKTKFQVFNICLIILQISFFEDTVSSMYKANQTATRSRYFMVKYCLKC